MTEEKMLKAIEDDKLTWFDISYKPLSEEFMEKHFDELDKYNISRYQKLSEEFIEKHFDKLDKTGISIHQKLSEKFIEKYFDELDKKYISIFQKLSEEFIENHFDKLNKEYIPTSQNLTEIFIEKHLDKLDNDCISYYQYLSPEFRQKHNLPLPYDSWMYWSREQKEKYIRENTNYEIKDGKVIAYKSTRKNGYSVFSLHYHYEVGKEYESHCDYNSDTEDSFGLSAWSKGGALNYYNKGKLFIVEIDLDDLGCITYEGKIRCRKLRIIEEISEG